MNINSVEESKLNNPFTGIFKVCLGFILFSVLFAIVCGSAFASEYDGTPIQPNNFYDFTFDFDSRYPLNDNILLNNSSYPYLVFGSSHSDSWGSSISNPLLLYNGNSFGSSYSNSPNSNYLIYRLSGVSEYAFRWNDNHYSFDFGSSSTIRWTFSDNSFISYAFEFSEPINLAFSVDTTYDDFSFDLKIYSYDNGFYYLVNDLYNLTDISYCNIFNGRYHIVLIPHFNKSTTRYWGTFFRLYANEIGFSSEPSLPDFDNDLPSDIDNGSNITNYYTVSNNAFTDLGSSFVHGTQIFGSFSDDPSVLALYPIDSFTYKGPTPESEQGFLERLANWSSQYLSVSGVGFDSFAAFFETVLGVEGAQPENNTIYNVRFSRNLYLPLDLDSSQYDVVYFNPLTDNLMSLIQGYSSYYDIVMYPSISISGTWVSSWAGDSGTFSISNVVQSSVFVSERYYLKQINKNLNGGFSSVNQALKVLASNQSLTYKSLYQVMIDLQAEFPYLNNLIVSSDSDDTFFGRLDTIISKLDNLPSGFDDSSLMVKLDNIIDLLGQNDFFNEIDTPFEVGFDIFDFSDGVLNIFGSSGGNDDLFDYFTNFFGLGDTGFFSFFDEAIGFFDFFDTTPDDAQNGLFNEFFE
ncbi:MAG: hypothetical protein MJ232_03080 [archaeon]|nr:hypothetical protein [archaeon]